MPYWIGDLLNSEGFSLSRLLECNFLIFCCISYKSQHGKSATVAFPMSSYIEHLQSWLFSMSQVIWTIESVASRYFLTLTSSSATMGLKIFCQIYVQTFNLRLMDSVTYDLLNVQIQLRQWCSIVVNHWEHAVWCEAARPWRRRPYERVSSETQEKVVT